MEYRGLIETSEEKLATRGHYSKIGQQAINDFLNKNLKCAKVDIHYTDEKALKSLYNVMKSFARRKNLPIRISMRKDKATNKQEIYLIKEI